MTVKHTSGTGHEALPVRQQEETRPRTSSEASISFVPILSSSPPEQTTVRPRKVSISSSSPPSVTASTASLRKSSISADGAAAQLKTETSKPVKTNFWGRRPKSTGHVIKKNPLLEIAQAATPSALSPIGQEDQISSREILEATAPPLSSISSSPPSLSNSFLASLSQRKTPVASPTSSPPPSSPPSSRSESTTSSPSGSNLQRKPSISEENEMHSLKMETPKSGKTNIWGRRARTTGSIIVKKNPLSEAPPAIDPPPSEAQLKELILTDVELATDINCLFRGDSSASYSIKKYIDSHCKEWITRFIAGDIQAILEKTTHDSKEIAKQFASLPVKGALDEGYFAANAGMIIELIFKSIESKGLPDRIKNLLCLMYESSKAKFPDQNCAKIVFSNFLLRIIVPRFTEDVPKEDLCHRGKLMRQIFPLLNEAPCPSFIETLLTPPN